MQPNPTLQFDEYNRNVIPIYNTVKYAIFMKFSDVVRLFSQYYQKKNKVIRIELESELLSLILLIISAYDKDLKKLFVGDAYSTFRKIYERLEKKAETKIEEDEISHLLVEIPKLLNVIGVTDIALKPRSKTDDFAGF